MKNKEPLCEFIDHDGKGMTVRSHIDFYDYTEILDESGQYSALFLTDATEKKMKRACELTVELYRVFNEK